MTGVEEFAGFRGLGSASRIVGESSGLRRQGAGEWARWPGPPRRASESAAAAVPARAPARWPPVRGGARAGRRAGPRGRSCRRGGSGRRRGGRRAPAPRGRRRCSGPARPPAGRHERRPRSPMPPLRGASSRGRVPGPFRLLDADVERHAFDFGDGGGELEDFAVRDQAVGLEDDLALASRTPSATALRTPPRA